VQMDTGKHFLATGIAKVWNIALIKFGYVIHMNAHRINASPTESNSKGEYDHDQETFHRTGGHDQRA